MVIQKQRNIPFRFMDKCHDMYTYWKRQFNEFPILIIHYPKNHIKKAYSIYYIEHEPVAQLVRALVL